MTIVDITVICILSISSLIWFKVLQTKRELDKDGSVRAFIERRS